MAFESRLITLLQGNKRVELSATVGDSSTDENGNAYRPLHRLVSASNGKVIWKRGVQ